MKMFFRIHKQKIKYILILFLLSRVFLEGAGLIGDRWLKNVSTNPSEWQETNTNIPSLDIWAVWDSGWYLNIAKYGYSNVTPENHPSVVTPQMHNIGFFPLYPVFIQGISYITQNNYVAALIVSNLALLISCFLLYEIVMEKYDEMTAKQTIKYLLIFPTSFILSGVFSESLFLLFLLICFYFAQKGKWGVVGVSGYFLSLTRPTGFLLVIPLLFLYLKNCRFEFKKIKPNILYLSLFGMGVFTFMIYTHLLNGDFLAYFHAQETGWLVTHSNPLNMLQMLYLYSPSTRIVFWFILAELFLIFIHIKKVSLDYLLVAAILLGIPLIEGFGPTFSLPRMSVVVFPLFIIIAKMAKDKYVDSALTFGLLFLQFILMILWSNGILII